MNLSQEEINDLLGSVQDDGTADSPDRPPEIDEQRTQQDLPASAPPAVTEILELPSSLGPEYALTPEEIDTLGEVGNICMGAVATTMYTLLERRTSITTPRVAVHTTEEVLRMYQVPFLVVDVKYIEGIEGKNLLLIKEKDAALITELLMGGDGENIEQVELNELHISALNEIMNQMIGASATALSKLLEAQINISTPVSRHIGQHLEGEQLEDINGGEIVVKISFDMVIEGLLSSQLLQLIPFDLARKLAGELRGVAGKGEPAPVFLYPPEPEPEPVPEPEPLPAPEATPLPPSAPRPAEGPAVATRPMAPQAAYPPPPPPPEPGDLVSVQAAQFGAFDEAEPAPPSSQGIHLIQDIPLQVSVELGKTRQQISDVLAFGLGTVVVLEKLAGDPVEVLVNGKLIARGEVVVIDEYYGVRITEIIH
ncbi:MAG: flagellar motor switch phosphatase FliY [Clostridiales bacterium]|nr:flagellar motor switch phosphatase FliY [Clostridiales bacterium]